MSGGFLYLIAALNVVVLLSIVKVFRELRQGKYDDEELERQLNSRGLMNRFFGPLARRIDTPWKMYPIGVLFGLGFDTATEVALLVLAGDRRRRAACRSTPSCRCPILFAAGMSLFDTIDGCFMNFAYGWAFAKPIRKVYYNITITGLSVFVAFFIGTIELLGLIGQEAQPGRRVLGVLRSASTSTPPASSSWAVRGDVGGGAAHLALRPHRGQVGRVGPSGP